MSFGTIRLPEEHHARGYKTPTASKGKEEDNFGEVLLPFSSSTAKQDEVMQDMKAMSIWGNRGVEGAVDLEI